MGKLVWDAVGTKEFDNGVDHAVLYPMDANGAYPLGVVWNGVTAITESPSGAEANPLYADNIKYLNLIAAEEFGCTIEAYMYPDEFMACDGSATVKPGMTAGQQTRSQFGLVYRTLMGNDVDGQNHGYKLHLIYGCLASPSERNYQTVNDSPEAISFSWEVKTTPVPVTGFKPTASITIDSTKVSASLLADLEDALFGTDGTPGTPPNLPLPDAVAALLTAAPPVG